MNKILITMAAAAIAAPLFAWQPPAWGEKKNAAPTDGKRTWPEIVKVVKATFPKLGVSMEIDEKGFVKYSDMGALDLNGSLTAEEERTQMAVWAAMAVPFQWIGPEAKLRDSTRQIIANRDFQNVSQDFVGRQAYPVYEKDDAFVLLKDCWGLNCANKVVTFVNFSDRPVEIKIALADLELVGPARVTDVLDGAPAEKNVTGPLAVKLAPHAAKLYRVFGKQGLMRRLYTKDAALFGELGDDIQFRQVYAPKEAVYDLTVNAKDGVKYAVQVNGLYVAKGLKGAAKVAIPLYGRDNTIRFVKEAQGPLDISSIEVKPRQ